MEPPSFKTIVFKVMNTSSEPIRYHITKEDDSICVVLNRLLSQLDLGTLTEILRNVEKSTISIRFPPNYDRRGEEPTMYLSAKLNTTAVPPLSGHRITLNTASTVFPDHSASGPPVCFDIDGSPLYMGSARFKHSLHPCKIGTHLVMSVMVPFGDHEILHRGEYNLLPFIPEQMEFVPASRGRIPDNRKPVDGGYEENGDKLYHAIAVVDGVRVPGKTGAHLGGCNVGFKGKEHNNYEILCWRVGAIG